MSEKNPIRVFVTHVFSDHPDYHRVFEYLESSSNFFYVNCSAPDKLPAAGGKEALKEALLGQIRAAEAIIVISSMYSENRDWITFQMDAAQAAELPIVALEPFGGAGKVPDEVRARAAEVVGWNERLLVDALRRQARHEETTRWDVIEFDMS
jgi:Thoeris protein ThsB, TIR-like domain